MLYFILLLGFDVASSGCPKDYQEHPLVLVSLDGFRPDYLQRNLTPNIFKMRKGGVTAPYMAPSFPSLTFPNHYTIVTGLYPESHGIIANSFYDPKIGRMFDKSWTSSLDGEWWGGEPIWNTAIKQNKKSATYFWPGSDAYIEKMHPTYYKPYDGTVPFEERIDTVLDWLSLPKDSRPSFICTYFDEPDHCGHEHGPDASETNFTITEVDRMIGRLFDGIEALGLTDCVNVILVSDHGMAESDRRRMIELTDYVPNINETAYVFSGSFARIDMKESYKGILNQVRENLTCRTPDMMQFSPRELPARYHFSNNQRIEDIVLGLGLGYVANVESSFFLEGQHGYDSYYKDMHALFVGKGPALLEGAEIESFQNVELYNMMCHLIGVKPAENNGTSASLNGLLKHPPPYPDTPKVIVLDSPVFPSAREIEERKSASGCPGVAPLDLNFTEAEKTDILTKHCPWGTPQFPSPDNDTILLHHPDHVTAFSQKSRIPLWTSFTAQNVSEIDLSGFEWTSDIRLTEENSPTCDDYEKLRHLNITMQPLFPKEFETSLTPDSLFRLVSNAVPMREEFLARWETLIRKRLIKWLKAEPGEINVVMGPIFDSINCSLQEGHILKGEVRIPDSYFLAVTRCLIQDFRQLNLCPGEALDSVAFIYPGLHDVPNCMSDDQYALFYSARIRDVELFTGLGFYPLLSYEKSRRLALRIHTLMWN